jgi:hypothetical protein
MNFNNILIGSRTPRGWSLLPGCSWATMADSGYTGWQIGEGFIAVGAHSEVHGRNDSPGRIIWNIEKQTSRAPSSGSRRQADRRPRALRLRAGTGLLDRDVRGPRRQLFS